MKRCWWCGKPVEKGGCCSERCLRKFREYRRAYQKSDKFKAYLRAYQKSDKYKAYLRAYRKSDKFKARRNERVGLKRVITEYHFLLSLKEPSVRQMRRLEALAEYFGRDIDEWRNEKQREEYNQILARCAREKKG